MSHSFTQIYLHIVFTTKNRYPFLYKEIRGRIHQYMGGISKNKDFRILCVGGVEDHVHLLVSLSKCDSVAGVLGIIKGSSSKWIHETFDELKMFAWQGGYGAISISPRNLSHARKYILNQEQHHKNMSFSDEMKIFKNFS